MFTKYEGNMKNILYIGYFLFPVILGSDVEQSLIPVNQLKQTELGRSRKAWCYSIIYLLIYRKSTTSK